MMCLVTGEALERALIHYTHLQGSRRASVLWIRSPSSPVLDFVVGLILDFQSSIDNAICIKWQKGQI